jgi:hypothetical protein
MLPALTALQRTPARGVTRFAIVYTPNGVVMDRWIPAREGTNFDLPPVLAPLAAYRDKMIIVSGLDSKNADPLPGEGQGDHARASAAFLTGVHPKKTEGPDITAGMSLDQIVAKELGAETQLSSLELALDATETVGNCDAGYACAYVNTLCWRGASTPLPMEIDPRAVFERLFGDGDSTNPAERAQRLRENRSILDSVTEKAARLRSALDRSDQRKLDDYLEAVREVERRIEKAEEQNDRELPAVDKPAGVPATYEEHAKLMFDLQVLAYQADLTRVITFMMAREISLRPYPEIGVPDPHHPLTHHRGDAGMIEKVAKINVFHNQLFSYYLDRLHAAPDGDGSLLDHLVILRGSGMSEGNGHRHDNLPILIAGGGSGRLRGGRHIKAPASTPLCNVFVGLLDKLDISVDRFGDSNGRIDLGGAAL